MRIWKMIAIQMLMLLVCCATATADINLNRTLLESINAFYEEETTVEHPVYVTRYTLGAEQMMALVSGGGIANLGELEIIEDEQISGRWVYFAEQNLSGKMLDSFVVCSMDWKYEWIWNAYEAGERALWCIQELMQYTVNDQNGYDGIYFEPRLMVGQDSELIMYKIPLNEFGYLPYNRNSYEELSQSCNGEFSIVGLDSAYTIGENEMFKWELYPFVIVDDEGYGFENAIYIYYRQVVPMEVYGGNPEGEQIEEYIIADQNRVADIFSQMINTIPNLSNTDREWMAGLIQYADALSKLTDEERKTLMNADPASTDKEKVNLPEAEEKDFQVRVLSDGTIEITGYIGEMTQFAIPQIIQGRVVTSIGEDAFNSCDTITAVAMPDSIKSIGDNAFTWCYQLQCIELPSGLTNIGRGAFMQCKMLKEIDMPDAVRTVGPFAFGDCVRLEKVHISTGLKAIENRMFENCYSLVDVEIPDGVIRIDYGVFRYCYRLKSVYIPSSVKEIGDEAFLTKYYDNDVTIYSPQVENIKRLFRNPSLYKYSDKRMPSEYELYETEQLEDGTLRITVYNGREQFVEIPSEICGSKVTEIGEGAFARNCQIEEVIIPDSIVRIGRAAFSVCLSLKKIHIPDSVISIGGEAFDSCDELTEVTLSNRLTEITGRMFNFCQSLETISIPQSVKKIGDEAFQYCQRLKTVTLPNKLDELGNGVFYNCTQMEQISIPSSVTLIGAKAFEKCENLEVLVERGSFADIYVQNYFEWIKIKYSIPKTSDVQDYVEKAEVDSNAQDVMKTVWAYEKLEDGTIEIIKYNGNGVEVTVPNTVDNYRVTMIGERAFYENQIVERITVPHGVKKIGDSAFEGCTRLLAIQLPDTLKEIGKAAFKSCSHLYMIDIPQNVNALGEGIFAGCSALMIATLPEECVAIPANAFWRCPMLLRVSFSSKLTYIGDYAFENCESLEEFSLPDSVNFIGSSAFENCERFKNVVIPDGVRVLEGRVFSNFSLEAVRIPESVVAIDAYAFYGNNHGERDMVMEVAKGSYAESYAKNNGWKYTYYQPKRRTAETIITANSADFVYEISNGEYAVITDYVGSQSRIRIPDRLGGYVVKEIHRSAFQNSYSLKEVIIPNCVTSIGSRAFMGCGSLEKVTLPSNLKKLEDRCFYDCKRLADVKLPEGLESIGENVFLIGRGLKSLTIPASVTKMSKYFYHETMNHPTAKDFVLYVKRGSIAENVARERKLKSKYY